MLYLRLRIEKVLPYLSQKHPYFLNFPFINIRENPQTECFHAIEEIQEIV